MFLSYQFLVAARTAAWAEAKQVIAARAAQIEHARKVSRQAVTERGEFSSGGTWPTSFDDTCTTPTSEHQAERQYGWAKNNVEVAYGPVVVCRSHAKHCWRIIRLDHQLRQVIGWFDTATDDTADFDHADEAAMRWSAQVELDAATDDVGFTKGDGLWEARQLEATVENMRWVHYRSQREARAQMIAWATQHERFVPPPINPKSGQSRFTNFKAKTVTRLPTADREQMLAD